MIFWERKVFFLIIFRGTSRQDLVRPVNICTNCINGALVQITKFHSILILYDEQFKWTPTNDQHYGLHVSKSLRNIFRKQLNIIRALRTATLLLTSEILQNLLTFSEALINTMAVLCQDGW
jgi:hypothetical protein